MPESALAQTSALQGLVRDYAQLRRHSEMLVAPLSAEDCLVQSMPDASPAKWHLAHTSWFFEALVLVPLAADYQVFDSDYAFLFNSYYEGLGPRHPRARRSMLARPSLEKILAYRAHVDAAVTALCTDARAAKPILLGMQHEQQHQELILTDIKHAFFANPLLPAYAPAPLSKPAPPAFIGEDGAPLSWIRHDGGVAEIGHAGKGFAFDNECPRHQVLLHPFRIASRPVTNGEYLAFIEDGGYRRPEFWLSDGWALACAEGWNAPLYWMSDDAGRSVFTLGGVGPLDPGAPLEHVSFFEASAFAAWSGKRLPTEFEWEASAAHFASGEVWEWTRSSYDPYPGYRPFDGAAGEYNGKFMNGQMVLRGGSRATPPGHARRTYRNFFPPQARWQFSGIRLAEDA